MKNTISSPWIPLIITIFGLTFLYLGFFNKYGRFYQQKQNLMQSAQIQNLDHQAAYITYDSFDFLKLSPKNKVDFTALKKLETIKPLNKERKKQKETVLKRVNKIKHKIEENNNNQNKAS